MKQQLRIVIAVMSVMLLFSVHVCAKNITLEAENYYTATRNWRVQGDGARSGGKYLSVQYTENGNANNVVRYKIEAEDAGWYLLTLQSTALNFQFCSNYTVVINDTRTINAREEGKETSIGGSNVWSTVDLGCVYLNKGTNYMKVIANDQRAADSQICFYLDTIAFTKSIWCVSDVIPVRPVNVFERSDNVTFEIKANYPESTEKKLSFRVENYWGTEVEKNDLTIGRNKQIYSLQLGQLPLGWYKLFVYNEGGSVAYEGSFSVVEDASKRQTFYDSPFAMDMAANGEVAKKDRDAYIRACKLTGVGWVRERWYYMDGYSELNDSQKSLFQKYKDAGLKILMCTHGMNQKIADNLFDTYQTTKGRANAAGDTIEVWELGNEPDLAFWGGTADEFAAFYKAGALGFEDSGENITKMYGAFSEETLILSGGCGDFAESMMMNDVMRYSDVYTYHSYAKNMNMNVSNKPKVHDLSLQRQALSYDKNQKPMWLTEGGMGQMRAKTKDGGLYDEQIRGMARASVQTMARSASEGVQKHFWFIMHGDYNVNQFFSCFTNDGKPYAVYNAISNMTAQLGEGKYLGKISNAPDYIEGYVFETEGKNAVVLWSDRPYEYLLKASGAVRAVDFMGNEISISKNADGAYVIPVGIEPVYILADDFGAENYYAEIPRVVSEEKKELTAADRIVIRQKFTGERKAKTKTFGYCIEPEKEYEFMIQVYNFNDQQMTGTIRAEIGEDYNLSKDSFEVDIPPMDFVEFPVTVSLKEDAFAEKQSYFSFIGTFDGQEASPSVSRLYCDKKPEIVENEAILENSDKAEAWDTSNIMAGGEATATQVDENTLEFNVRWNGGDHWFYPWLKMDGSVLKDKTGFSYWVYADETLAKSGSTMYIMLWLEDGRQYFLDARVNFEEGWNQVKKSFDSFILMSSPFGALDDRPFDPTQIATFSIGTNASLDELKYQLRDIGYYTEESGASGASVLTISGIENNGSYQQNAVPTASVQLPENFDAESIRVLIGNQEYEHFTVNGQNIAIDLNSLPRGKYQLFVACELSGAISHVRRDSVDFIVK